MSVNLWIRVNGLYRYHLLIHVSIVFVSLPWQTQPVVQPFFIEMGSGQRGWVAKTLVSINDSCHIISSGALLQDEADGCERQDFKNCARGRKRWNTAAALQRLYSPLFGKSEGLEFGYWRFSSLLACLFRARSFTDSLRNPDWTSGAEPHD